jgi:hypothetical protein
LRGRPAGLVVERNFSTALASTNQSRPIFRATITPRLIIACTRRTETPSLAAASLVVMSDINNQIGTMLSTG